jgi:malate dehydrogenase (oxaloacetate-decarboxylating)(NADP+)
VRDRAGLAPHNLPYAHAVPGASFIEAIRRFRPQVLIGATGAPGTFDEEVVRLMAELNPRPVIFALSNPTSRAECSAEQAIGWSEGRAVFASGSPFAPVAYQGREYRPGQGNNAYVFPGIGLGAIACGMRTISDEVFLTAAQTLAGMVKEEDLAAGSVYPPLTDIRKVSLAIAVAVAEQAWAQGLARAERPDDPEDMIAGMMYDPVY